MIKITMKNGFYYKGEIIDENDDFLILNDIKGKRIELRKTEISVKEVDWEMTNYKVFIGKKYIGLMTPAAFVKYSYLHPTAWAKRRE